MKIEYPLSIEVYFGFEIIQMHNPSGKLKYYIRGANQEWPTLDMCKKVIRAVVEFEGQPDV